MDILLALLGAGSAGGFSAIGAAANTRLRQALHSPIAAALINFGVGLTVLSLLVLLGIVPSIPLEKLAMVPWWAFGGGFLGVVFVTLSTVTIPKLGLTTTTLAIVCSQMAMSVLVDQFGWLGIAPQPLSLDKIMAIGLLLLAIVLTQLDTGSR